MNNGELQASMVQHACAPGQAYTRVAPYKPFKRSQLGIWYALARSAWPHLRACNMNNQYGYPQLCYQLRLGKVLVEHQKCQRAIYVTD